MIAEENFEEYKRKEYLGDALLLFIVRETLCTDWKIRHTQRKLEFALHSNKKLAEIAKKIGLGPPKMDEDTGYYTKKDKPYANALEVRIYEEYLSGGIEGAKKWFVENVLPHATV